MAPPDFAVAQLRRVRIDRHGPAGNLPEDVSIVGCDDVPEVAWKGYDLTTVAQSRRKMIGATVGILLEQIENEVVNVSGLVIADGRGPSARQ